MSNPIVHAEIRSSDPDARRVFFADKVLKMLEWVAEDEDAETAKAESRSTHLH